MLFLLSLFDSPDLCLKCLQFLLGGIDPLLHLSDERFGILGCREETDVVLVGYDVLLELAVLLDKTVFLGKRLLLSTGGAAASSLRTGIEIRELGLESLVVGCLNILFFLERHKADALPLRRELLCGSEVCSCVFGKLVRLDLLDQSLLGLEVAIVVVFRLGLGIPLIEEGVAGGAETLPELLGLLARDSADLLPLLLESDQSFGGLLPLLAVLESLCLFDEGELLLHVRIHRVLELGIVLSLALEELVAGSTEPVVNLLVFLPRGESDGPPFLLDFLDFG